LKPKGERDRATPALVFALVVGLGAWWWALGGPPAHEDGTIAPSTDVARDPRRMETHERPPGVATVIRTPPAAERAAETDFYGQVANQLSEIMLHPVQCRLAEVEPESMGGRLYRARDGHELPTGIAMAMGDVLLLDLMADPGPGAAWIELRDGRRASFSLVGDPLRCDPDPVGLEPAWTRAHVVLKVRNSGTLGQTEVSGCGGHGLNDGDGKVDLYLLADALESGCSVTVTRRDGLLDVPGAEIELGPDDADGTIDVVLPEWRTGGLGVSIAPGPDGILLESVTGGSPADMAGLRPGDRLLTADGEPLPEDFDAARGLLTGPEGTDVVLEVESDGEIRTVRVTRAVIEE
jgi:hypothetical protein